MARYWLDPSPLTRSSRKAENRCAARKTPGPAPRRYALRTLLWITLAMPAAIFLLAGRALVVRGRLERHGLTARATVTSYQQWTDDMTHHDVTYRFTVGGGEYNGSGSANRIYDEGEPIEVIYHAERPDFNQLVAGGVRTSPGLNVAVMVAMVLAELWLFSLLSLH
jgi:hypothetical protein